MPVSAKAAAEPSLVEEDLARFDLLTILITNEAFIRAASSSLLAKLLRVSKQTRAILNTDKVQERLWLAYLQITPEFLFNGVDPSIDRLKVLQGLFYYALRQNEHKPTSPSMLKKENELWSEVYRDRQLFDRVQRFCQVTDPKFRFPEEARPNGSEQPSVEEMVAIAERQSFGICWSIRVNSRNRLTIRPNDITDRTAYVSKLLPFDIAGIDRAREKRLTIEGVSFLEVSGWPKTLSNIQGLTIKHKLFGRVADPLISLEGMPSELPKLIALDLSGCSQLTSLKGMPEMPMLLELNIPVGMETIVGIPEELPSLTKLVISSHMPHNILSQLPSMPRLNHLILPNRFVSLADLHVNQSSLKVLNLHACYELKSLDGIPPYPRLEILHASSQIKRVRGLVHKLPSLKTLHLDSSIRMFDRSWLTDCFGRYADYFNLGWRITSWRISGLPKGCRVVFNNTFEYTFGRFSSWLGMELLNILCFLYLALSLVPLSIAGLFFVLLTMVWTIVLAITFGLTKLF